MKYYSNNFKKHFNNLDIDTSITGYRTSKESTNILRIGVKMDRNEPLSTADAENITKFIAHCLMLDKFFRSDRARVDNVLWLLDAMDDDCQDFSDYEADIVNE